MTDTIIAVVGASASGKTLFAQTVYSELQSELPDIDLQILAEDCYYRDQSHLSMEERVETNYDHPEAFEHNLLVDHLCALRNKQSVQVPQYDYTHHNRSATVRSLEPARVVIVEGILLLADEALRNLFDIKIFVDTPLDICLLRRMARDIQQRGRSLESVTQQYQATVRPMFYQFIEPSKQFADIVVTRGGKNRIAIEMVKSKILRILS